METLQIEIKKSFWQLILECLRIESQNVKFGNFTHYWKEGATSKKIQEGSILFGRSKNEKGVEFFGGHLVLSFDGKVAKTQKLIHTEIKL